MAGGREAGARTCRAMPLTSGHRGFPGAVLEWLEDLTETELDQHPRLRLAAAWAWP